MSREILFRAKCIDNGHSEWVEGNLVYTPENDDDFRYIIIPQHNNGMYTKMPDLGLEKWYQVDPSTVCQYTGLKDASGAKIWEGDIILVKEPSNSDVGIVRYGEYGHICGGTDFHVGFYVDWQNNNIMWRNDLGYWVKYYNVRGNAFDNPELLETEQIPKPVYNLKASE